MLAPGMPLIRSNTVFVWFPQAMSTACAKRVIFTANLKDHSVKLNRPTQISIESAVSLKHEDSPALRCQELAKHPASRHITLARKDKFLCATYRPASQSGRRSQAGMP